MASFFGIGGLSLSPHMMQIEIERNSAQMRTIVTYSNSSDRNADTLGDYLCASLAEYAERFKPGTEIDEQTLSARSYVQGTQPDYGLAIQAYLLLEVARQKKSAPFTRRALSTLYDVVLADSYFAEKLTLYKHPDHSDYIAREKREFGGSGTNLGAEIAWCCEQFMVRASQFNRPRIPEPGMVVIADYCRWRKDTLAIWGSPHYRDLDLSQRHRTMAYVKKLVAALAPDQQD